MRPITIIRASGPRMPSWAKPRLGGYLPRGRQTYLSCHHPPQHARKERVPLLAGLYTITLDDHVNSKPLLISKALTPHAQPGIRHRDAWWAGHPPRSPQPAEISNARSFLRIADPPHPSIRGGLCRRSAVELPRLFRSFLAWLLLKLIDSSGLPVSL